MRTPNPDSSCSLAATKFSVTCWISPWQLSDATPVGPNAQASKKKRTLRAIKTLLPRPRSSYLLSEAIGLQSVLLPVSLLLSMSIPERFKPSNPNCTPHHKPSKPMRYPFIPGTNHANTDTQNDKDNIYQSRIINSDNTNPDASKGLIVSALGPLRTQESGPWKHRVPITLMTTSVKSCTFRLEAVNLDPIQAPKMNSTELTPDQKGSGLRA